MAQTLILSRFSPQCYGPVNPVQTQAVTYIVQRMASMAGMFYIMSHVFLPQRQNIKLKFLQEHWTLFTFALLVVLIGDIYQKKMPPCLPLIIITYDLFLIKGITRKEPEKVYLFLLIRQPLSLFFSLASRH